MPDARKTFRLWPRSGGTGSVTGAPATGPVRLASPKATGIVAQPVDGAACPHCGRALNAGTSATPLTTVVCAGCAKPFLVPGRLEGFVLVERAGAGEMGEIYRARDEALNRDVAIKVVRGPYAEDKASQERLRQEACAAAKLYHPHVAQVHALGFSNGHPYIVMEFVRGEDLDARLRAKGRIDEATALRAALDVTEGLRALHGDSLTHGDIKPANIVLAPDGGAKLVDFGLSGMTRRDETGAILGTPHYIAPELVRGALDTPASDIYSLGATLYHVLTGRTPFDGKTPLDVVKARLSGPVRPVGLRGVDISLGTQRMVMRMLEREPARRYPDCAALAADIRAALSALATAAAPPDQGAAQVRAPVPRSRSRPILTFLLATVAAVEAVVAAVMYGPSCAPGRPAGRVAPVVAPASAARRSGPATSGAVAAVRTPAAPSGYGVVTGASGVTDDPGWPVFARLCTPAWQSTDVGAATTRGSTVWRADTLYVQGEGNDIVGNADSCRFVHAGVEGPFALSVRVNAIAVTHRNAKSGILVRAESLESGPGLFFGFQGDGALLFLVRRPGGTTMRVRASDHPEDVRAWQSTHLRLERYGSRFRALSSRDGATWEPFAACTADLAPQVEAGVSVSSREPGVLATAEFRDIRLLAAVNP